ncbi:TetR/AcrR family transcriptional regulator [Rhizobium laguerreae]|uniref:TetR/AcrR family transcriptional regulator n=1 Tax=Rhizobium laguerreae TaxID=1076926 RepID=UPI001441F27F|nr:TetR/AcrR family transcriptional regulator [Rhizobium laguerreae]NKN10588.1 TetR family transcriptional regulator [Rhizobium laguerreae]
MNTPKRIDRRVARTRTMLQKALVSLILRKGYDAVTVEDICEAADVGRSTFYAHFTGREDLKRSSLDDHLRVMLIARQRQAMTASGDAEDRKLAFALGMFEHARDHMDLYRALVRGRGGAIAFDQIRDILCDLVRAEIPANRDVNSSPPREFIVEFIVGAFLAVLTWWLDGGAKLPPERVNEMFRSLATQGMPISQSNE